jgi:hypothetical protein
MRRHFDHFLPFQIEENRMKDEQKSENGATDYSHYDHDRELHKPPETHD